MPVCPTDHYIPIMSHDHAFATSNIMYFKDKKATFFNQALCTCMKGACSEVVQVITLHTAVTWQVLRIVVSRVRAHGRLSTSCNFCLHGVCIMLH